MLDMERSELGGCLLAERIGAGAMGEVYLAEQVRLGNRLVAVKVVRAGREVSLPDSEGGDVERRFIREAQLLGRLTHPNILPVYHGGIEAGYLFLVMQYVPDGSLADAIKGKGPHRLALPANLPFVVDITGQVADALQYTHEHGVIHADVKPGNVLMQIEPNGHVHALLADFGIARSGDTIASRNEFAGTLAYMAPEQFNGQVSAACDQYALGVMAFQLLSGRLPFVGGLLEIAQAHARENPPSLCALNPAVAPAVEEVIRRALAKHPADRYPSVAAFAEALRAAVTGASTVRDANTRGVGPAFLGRPEERPSGVTTRAAAATTVKEPPMALAARPATAGLPATRRTWGRARRRIVPGLAVIAVLLAAGIAAIGLRSHIDVSGASSTHGTVSGSSQTPTATGVPAAGTNPASSPDGGFTPQATPTAPLTVSPPPAATAVPTAVPTATAASQPTATASPSPTLPPATAAPAPTATSTTPATLPTATAAPRPTVAPRPTATASAPPKSPPATAAPRPTATPATPATPLQS